jgi:hypothetical protein
VELQSAVNVTLQPVQASLGFQLNQEDILMEDEDMVLAQDLNVLDHPERVEDPPAPLQAEVIPSAAIIARLAANFNSSSRVQDVPLAPLQPLEDVNVASNSDL